MKSPKRITESPRKDRAGPRAFSLIEIALALAVISFAVVGLIGLLALALDSSRASGDDTYVASMARQVVAELRAGTFDGIAGKLGTDGSEIFYFDNEAHKLAAAPGAVFSCKAVLTANPDYSTTGTSGTPVVNLYEVRLQFSKGGAAAGSLGSLQSSIARYD